MLASCDHTAGIFLPCHTARTQAEPKSLVPWAACVHAPWPYCGKLRQDNDATAWMRPLHRATLA
eukprot:6463676-Amphidinium_carterae.3